MSAYDDLIDVEPDDDVPTRADVLRSKLLDVEQLAKLPPPIPLIDEWLMSDSLANLYGPSGCGKTFVALDIAAHVASAKQWWHGNEAVSGPVIYIAAEGVAGMAQRTRAWSTHHDLEPDQLRFIPMAVDLFDYAWAEALVELAEELRPVLIVVDTLARSIVGADENSAKDIGIVVARLDQIRRASGACVLVVHHAGKDKSNGARGSSALRAAMDTELELTGDGDYQTLKCRKQKDAAEPTQLVMERTFVAGTDSCAITVTTNRPTTANSDDIESAVLAAIRAEQPVATRALRPLVRSQGVSVSNEAIADTVALLVHRQDVVETAGPRNARLFSLPNRGKS